MKLWPKRLPWLLCFAMTATLMQSPPALARGETPVDQLVVGMSMINLLSLDPAGATGLEVAEVNSNVYDMLLEQDAARPDQLIPALAERWEISPDRMRLTFHLRTGVTFHSGNPLTAQDVAWSLQRVVTLNKALASTWKAYGYTASNVSELMRAEGPSTFVLDLPKATDPMLVLNTLATSPSAFIIDRVTALQHAKGDDLGAGWLTTNTAGSGAFKLDIWRANDVILMSRFDHYWRGPAKMRRVIMRNMTESQALRLMVERGDLDVARGMAATDIKALTRSDEVTVQTIPRGTIYYVALSMEQPLFKDIRVRQAIRSLIDYQGINNVVMPHYGVINQRPLQLGLPARLDDPGYALNVAKAKRLLAEAGYPDGFRITIRSVTDSPFINIAT
ncbi:ABC transporter substrate-binding protein, partial [Pseudomonas viridiflava]|uniref:ABC transporter substrate-binding protein n=1 Tax=Pseudomonas viridiflava TaxID=33069 RepID=UPI0013D1C071